MIRVREAFPPDLRAHVSKYAFTGQKRDRYAQGDHKWFRKLIGDDKPDDLWIQVLVWDLDGKLSDGLKQVFTPADAKAAVAYARKLIADGEARMTNVEMRVREPHTRTSHIVASYGIFEPEDEVQENPAFIKTPRDERLWREARDIVRREYDVKVGSPQYWALVNGIFQRMKNRTGARVNPPKRRPDYYRGQAWFQSLSASEKQAFKKQIERGRDEEMEHTDDPATATKIALDHLAEDPHYYDGECPGCGRLTTKGLLCRRCAAERPEEDGLEFPEYRENPPSADLPLDQYRAFHGVDPDKVKEMRGVWYPGELVKIGTGVDIGYGNDHNRTEKRGWFVHDFDGGVEIFQRARSGEKWDRVVKNFPHDQLWVLGYNLGFTYKDKNGNKREVKGSQRKYLATTPDRQTLVVVGPDGVEFLATGGNMRVEDWIRG